MSLLTGGSEVASATAASELETIGSPWPAAAATALLTGSAGRASESERLSR